MSLAIRVFRDQRFELGHECGIASECEIRVDSFFERSQAELLQLCDGGGRERLGPQLRERVVPPEREGFVQQGGAVPGVGSLVRLRA